MTSPRLAILQRVIAAAAVIVSSACADGDKTTDTAAVAKAPAPSSKAATSAAMNSDSMAGMKTGSGMQGMTMTGNADRDFLRMMSDHHKGMIEMAHMTKDRKVRGPASADAERIDTKQDGELDDMMTMLEKTFKDAYAAKVTSDNKSMADELNGKTGLAYDRAFYANTIKHHQEAVTMIDAYLPTAKSAAVKQMAEKMKADQTKEIVEFQKKLSQMR